MCCVETHLSYSGTMKWVFVLPQNIKREWQQGHSTYLTDHWDNRHPARLPTLKLCFALRQAGIAESGSGTTDSLEAG